jgi:poly-gamma-glutamate synthesis protein (capsule biosynthesis protein)
MDNKIKGLILFIVLLISLLASSFFSDEKTITIGNNLDQEISPIVNTPEKPENNLSVLFVGDMMFDRYIRQIGEKKGYSFLFQKARFLLVNNDLVVGNLEGPITSNQSISLNSEMGKKNNYIFTFDPKLSGILADENIKLVNIGNNHIANFGSSGIENTRNYLTQSGVDFFGDPERNEKRMVIKYIKGLQIAFVNYNQFILEGKQKTIDDIGKAKNAKANIVVVYTHWGNEFVNEPDQKIKDLAHKFIDIGADLIIGTHPHVIQSKEEYNGKMIYYSLGNFIFDQYFNSDTQKGLAVQAEINLVNNRIDYHEYFVKMESSGQTILNTD